MNVPPTRRIVLLGKTGAGKSSVANTLFGETTFKMGHSPDSETSICKAKSKLINRRSITLVDTPGFFDTSRSEEDTKPNILQCIVECAPGPHAFIVVLKVEKFTDHEKSVIENMFQYFSEEVLRYAVILFTHGDQLLEEMKIEEFVSQSKCLADLVQKCGGRCHVIDNKYWNNEAKNKYRSNKFQVEQLLKTIDDIVMQNKGDYYTNDVLQAIETEIQKAAESIKQTSVTMSSEEARERAKSGVYKQHVAKFARIAGKGLLIAALLGGSEFAPLVPLAIKGVSTIKQAARKKRIETVSKEETSKGVTAVKAGGKAQTQSVSTPNKGTPTKETAVEKSIAGAKTGADIFSKLLKIFRKTNEEEVSASITDEAATLEEEAEDAEVEDGTEELVEEETGTAEVLPTIETDVPVEEEETDEGKVEMTQEVTTSMTGETPEVAAAAEAAEGALTTVNDVMDGAVLAGEGAAALTTAVEEETVGAVLSAAEEAAEEVALSAVGEALSVTALVDGMAEASIEGVEMEVVEGAAGVAAEAIDGVVQVMDVAVKVAESCCIQ
ncbi:uncharacterized protein LOC112846231 [Oreochromis niloticus]|uniref:uncharacterized protein LOC112846231 n=1 Tax=Oreochromis niloticus TaxID=8128 RepID=UPI000DF48D6B|nr:uncharacterized protein LOC112846231 [Oreochromis niloticus]